MKRRILILLLVLSVGLFGCGKKEDGTKQVRDFSEAHVAYVKINPSVKLNYTLACSEYSDGTKKCGAPLVTSYEAVNDDAKTILEGVDLLAESKNLKDVINEICKVAEEKGVKVESVSVESDWEDVKTYLATPTVPTNTEEQTTPGSGETQSEETVEPKQYNFEVEVQVEAEEKAAAEQKAKEEAEKKAKEEAERKAKEEAAAKERAAKTIYLSDNVTYDHTGRGYCCDGCITDAVIKTFKNAKGYAVTSASHDRIDFKKITKLSGKYNDSKFKGSDLTSKLTALGAEECGGLGGAEEPLTKAVCKEYNLLCE